MAGLFNNYPGYSLGGLNIPPRSADMFNPMVGGPPYGKKQFYLFTGRNTGKGLSHKKSSVQQIPCLKISKSKNAYRKLREKTTILLALNVILVIVQMYTLMKAIALW